MHERNAFVTLTYDDAKTNPGHSLRHRDWQLFAKRARKECGPFRYYMAGEYGTQNKRPHFHACLFGIDFDDKYPWRKNHNGDQLYRSETLERLWKHGNAEIGAVTFQSAAYVARYIMTKVTGDLATSHYTELTPEGEILNRRPEYNQMSRRPGLGATWYEKYHSDVYPSDTVITRGFPSKPPRYYDKLLERTKPELLEQLHQKRMAKLEKGEQTPRRLRAKEAVTKAKLAHLKRN